MKILHDIALVIIGLIFGATIYGSVQSWNQEESEPVVITEYKVIEKEPEVITNTVYIPYSPSRLALSVEDCALLEQIAYSEAKGEGVMGMALVMNVVLNRADKNEQTIRQVIYAPGQFYTQGMTDKVSEDCHTALNLVLNGMDESQGALFFNSCGYRNGKEPLFQYGNHYFSK